MSHLPESVAHAMHEMSVPAEPDAAFLSAVLRDPSRWPQGFGPWDYIGCSTCAIGLAAKLWDMPIDMGDTPRILGEALGLPAETAVLIFTGLFVKIKDDVSPDDVADALDAALAASVPA